MKPGPRRSISQADIVAAAFRVLEEKGFAAVSVRGVAGALGLTPTAMYTYFPSKRALMRAMLEELLARLDLDATSDAEVAWRDRVHALAATLRARLAEHPGAVVLVTAGPLDGPHALALGEALIAGFMAERMPLTDAAHAAHAVRAYVLGAALLDAAEVAALEGSAAKATTDPLWTDAAGFPLTEAVGDPVQGDAAFSFGLDRLLDGAFDRSARAAA